MKKLISCFAICLIAVPALAVAPAGRGRSTMSEQMRSAPRQTASTNQLSMASMTVSGTNKGDTTESNGNNSGSTNAGGSTENGTDDTSVDKREKEKNACINNNIGAGNTFVWASRYSNTNNYASMVEDIDEPDNNICFVKVELKSSDSKVNVSDIPGRYFEMGRTITCGSWADEETLKKRILDAKKSARTWGTVAGAVGGAAAGVGIMELFGNKLIGGAVEGQKSLKDDELIRSQLLVLKKEEPSQYKKFIDQLTILKTECENPIWASSGEKKPEECSQLDYDRLLNLNTNS